MQRVAKTYFTPESRVVIHMMPKGRRRAGAEVMAMRTLAPTAVVLAWPADCCARAVASAQPAPGLAT